MRKLLFCVAILSAGGLASAAPLKKKAFQRLDGEARQASKRGDAKALAKAVVGLAKDDSWRAVRAIATHAASTPSGATYTVAVKALAGMGSKAVLRKTNKAVVKSKGSDALRLMLIDSLAERNDPESAEALLAVLEGRDPVALRAALQAIRRRQPAGCVERLFVFLERMNSAKVPDGLLQSQAHRLLVGLTGLEREDLGDWRAAWSLEAERRAAGPVKLDESQTRTHRADNTRAGQFFGSKIHSTRVVFVVDASKSMQSNKRIVNAKDQLVAAIGGLPVGARFTVLAFAKELSLWRPELQAATAENRAAAQGFVRALELQLQTRSLEAIERAFQIKDADTIVFLSDGAPTDRDRLTKELFPLGEILGRIRVANRFERRQLDTFLFPPKKRKKKRKKPKPGRDPAALEVFMRELAKQNGGTFTRIDD
jgi:hypothetical protein